MARLEQAIKIAVDMFVEYADGDGKLNKEEFKKLLEKEIANPEIKAKMNAADFDKAMGRLDRNHDGEINFREFSKCLSVMVKRYYHMKTGKDQEATATACLEQAIKIAVDMFVEYADSDGKLNKRRDEKFRKTSEKEIENSEIKAKMNAADFDKAMGRLDRNHDGEINLETSKDQEGEDKTED